MREELKLAWGVTGSGTFLFETYQIMLGIKQKYGVKVTTFVSEAGLEILRMYGLRDKIKKISPGLYYEELVSRETDGASGVFSGRFNLRKYKVFAVSPVTANSVAKMVNGVADTCVTNAFAQALKGKVPVIVLPVDSKLGETEITLPCIIKREKCLNCKECTALTNCPVEAIESTKEGPKINLLKCIGCEKCVSACPFQAVACWEKAKIETREVDVENVNKLRKMKGVVVVEEPTRLLTKINEILET